MNKTTLLSTIANIFLAILTLGGSIVEAADGAELYRQKRCNFCHGDDAKASLLPNYPKLAGQNQNYLVAQMKDIKNESRHNGYSAAMKGMMTIINDEEIEAIAQWLASLPISKGTRGGDAVLAAKGATLYKSRTCFACHGADAKTPIYPFYPKLAGQNHLYAVAQMKDIKSGARDNNKTAVMKGVMGFVTEQEMEAMAEWLAFPSDDFGKIEDVQNIAKTTSDLEPETKKDIAAILDSIVLPWNKKSSEQEEALMLKPDLKHGREVYEVCAACHLPEGWGKLEGTYPQLAGQHRTVLIKQLADIRAGNRDNPTMYPFALPKEIGGAQAIADVVAYIAKLPMNPNNGIGLGDDLKHGRQLYMKNCARCHGRKGEGKSKKFYPRLQGQHYKYLLRQFEWIRYGKRRNANPKMVKRINSFTDRDMKAVMDYTSRLKPPKKDLAKAGWQNPDFD
jgi:cytochrome c553